MPPAEFPRAQAIETLSAVLLPLHGKRAMHLVSAHSNSSAVHNCLRRRCCPDYALLRPHLRPLVLPSSRTSSVPIGGSSLCVSLRPASRPSWQSNPRREWKSVSSAARGMSGTAVVLGGDQSPHSTYVQVAEQAQQITAQGHDREPIVVQRGGRNSKAVDARRRPCQIFAREAELPHHAMLPGEDIRLKGSRPFGAGAFFRATATC